ncbi:40S ribosomal protein S22 [Fusarium falciforme]|nr:40S ribosomal protein S22 [Fusarium falciforme]
MDEPIQFELQSDHQRLERRYKVRTSVLSDALKSINNAEKQGKRQVILRPSSKAIVRFLELMQRHDYISEFEEVDDHRDGKIAVQINGRFVMVIPQLSDEPSIAEIFYFRLNKCGVISPRFSVALGDLEKWVVRLLPARQFGHIVLTTSAGIMDHDQARRKHVSGKILRYFY